MPRQDIPLNDENGVPVKDNLVKDILAIAKEVELVEDEIHLEAWDEFLQRLVMLIVKWDHDIFDHAYKLGKKRQ